MPQVIAPTQVVTKDGECRVIITLELNINLNQLGEISVNAQEFKAKPIPKIDDRVEFEIPSFTSNKKIDFGK